MNFLVGTRSSKLALAQTNWVVQQLQNQSPAHTFTIKTITTKGDTDSRPLFTIDQKGIFEKEIDRAVLNKEIDFAVHSLKDVPSTLPAGLVLGCIPKRESPNDIFISKDGHDLESIPTDSIIGTSSLRRAVQVSAKRPDLTVKPIRGNIETRIRKIHQDSSFDALVLAQAGIHRLQMTLQYTLLSTTDFIPSPGQGAIGIVCRDPPNNNDDSQKSAQLYTALKKIEDQNTRLEIESERKLSDVIDSGCRFPIGANAQVLDDDTLTLCVSAFSIDGKKSLYVKQSGPKEQAIQIGHRAGKLLHERGIQKLAFNWRAHVEEWNKNGR